MNPVEFDIEMGRLYGVFPRSNFSDERRKLIFYIVESLPASSFRRIVDHFIATFRQAPLPKDFIEAKVRENHNAPRQSGAYSPAPDPNCEKCYDSGILEIQHESGPDIYFCRCRCYAGHMTDHTELPMWTYDLHAKEFKPLYSSEGRYKVWIPKDGISGLNEKVAIWKAQKKESLKFWRWWFEKRTKDEIFRNS